jgi:hypothetical protein
MAARSSFDNKADALPLLRRAELCVSFFGLMLCSSTLDWDHHDMEGTRYK